MTEITGSSNKILIDKTFACQNKLVQEVQENISSLKLVSSLTTQFLSSLTA